MKEGINPTYADIFTPFSPEKMLSVAMNVS